MSYEQTMKDAERVRKEIESRERILAAWMWLESHECTIEIVPGKKVVMTEEGRNRGTVYANSLLEAVEMFSLIKQQKMA